MSGDSVRLPLPIARVASGACEVTHLYGELRKPLLRYLVCLGLTNDEAQDVVQETFLTLHRHVTSGGSQENIRAWVFRVAHNQARNRQASYDRRFAAPLDAATESIRNETTPEETVLEKERFRQLGKAIRSLANSERDCLFLRAAGLHYREIGEVLSLATSTVADTVARAIRKLAEKCNV